MRIHITLLLTFLLDKVCQVHRKIKLLVAYTVQVSNGYHKLLLIVDDQAP